MDESIEKLLNDDIILSEVLKQAAEESQKIENDDHKEKSEQDDGLQTIAQAYLTSKCSTKVIPKKSPNWT